MIIAKGERSLSRVARPACRPMPGWLAAMVGTVVAAACTATTLTACTSSGPPPAGSVPAVDRVGSTLFTASQRRQVPPLAGRTIRGTSLRLAGLTGHGVVVLNVWASWCLPCRAESRTLAEMSGALASRGVRFVGIDEQDGAAKARAFAAARGRAVPEPVRSERTNAGSAHRTAEQWDPEHVGDRPQGVDRRAGDRRRPRSSAFSAHISN